MTTLDQLTWRWTAVALISTLLLLPDAQALPGMPSTATLSNSKLAAEFDAGARKPMLDVAESDAMTRCIEAFALYRPKQSLRVHVPWCENDYQIDVATPAGRAARIHIRRRPTNNPGVLRIFPTCTSAACPATASGGPRGMITTSSSPRGTSCLAT